MVRLGDVDSDAPRRGVSASELLERNQPRAGTLTAQGLHEWLIESGLAEPDGSLESLQPTRLAIEIAAAFE